MDGLFDLFLEAVIKIVVDLLRQFLIILGSEVKFAFFTHSSVSRLSAVLLTSKLAQSKG